MKKKVVSTLLALTLVLGSTGVTFASTYKFDNLGAVWSQIYKIWNGGAQGSVPQQPQQKPPQQNDTPQVNSSKAAEILNLVNKERSAAGLAGLKTDAQLDRLAQMKAEDMAKNNYFAHNSPTYGSAFDMMKNYGVPYRTAGENLAKGQKTSQAVMNGWMNSPGHRANIMEARYTRLGVGYTVDKNGTPYWVQMFAG